MKDHAVILRHIDARFEEEPHPFRHASAGMQAFSQLLPLLRHSVPWRLSGYVERIEELFPVVGNCPACKGKLCVYLDLYCKYEFPEKSRQYQAMLEAILAQDAAEFPGLRAPVRDYRKEVHLLLERYLGEGYRDYL
ncbi:MAG: hypothetical protein JXR37_34305 [Kiritimatiellae bacterium]|nr:hypothetical protein [Kiritimatiellia bacterium]